jgi:hypothetical protein
MIKDFYFGCKTEFSLINNEIIDIDTNDCNIKDMIPRENCADVKLRDIYEIKEIIKLSDNSKCTNESNTEDLNENEKQNLKSNGVRHGMR